MTGVRRWLWIAAWPVGLAVVALGDVGFIVNGTEPWETVPLDIAIGLAAVVAGLLVWARHPGNLVGPLLYLWGVCHAAGGLWSFDWYLIGGPWWAHQPLLAEICIAIGALTTGFMVHAIFAYPTGRLETRIAWLAVGLGYLGSAIWAGASLLDRSPEPLVNVLFLMLALGGTVVIAWRWYRAGSAARRVYAPVLAAALFVATTGLILEVLTVATGSEQRWAYLAHSGAKFLLPIGFLFGMMRSRLDWFGVGDLLVQLDRLQPTCSLRDVLAKTLHDPSLEVAYWMPERGVFVDRSGVAVDVPTDGPRRAVKFVEGDGEQLAAIVHDPALEDDPRLVEAVASAARMSIEGERLQAKVRAQLEEVRASRARIVAAADGERRRLERDLHDGAQQRLLSLALMVRMARDRTDGDLQLCTLLEEAEKEAHEALAEMRELAHGIHPAILTSEGLESAVETLVERAPLPVRMTVAAERFPQELEITAYYLVSEALANAVKHSHATHVEIAIGRRNGTLLVEVADDGVGGADPDGTGLRGLADRVAAHDGRLTVSSEKGTGTVVRAELPTG
jgi:signal transduction histidine kinase